MSTKQKIRKAKTLQRKIKGLRRSVKAWFLADGWCRLLLIVVGVCLLDFLMDRFFKMDRPQRLVMLVIMGLVAGWAIIKYLLRPMGAKVSDDALVIQVEKGKKGAGEALISALEFSRIDWSEHENVSMTMVDQTIKEGERLGRKVNMKRVLNDNRFRLNLVGGGFLTMLVIGAGVWICLDKASPAATWFNRNIMLGESQWPQDYVLQVDGADGGRLVIPRGDDWPLTAKIADGYRSLPEEVKLEIRTARGTRVEVMADMGEHLKFQSMLSAVSEDFEFRVVSRKFASEWASTVLVDRPEVEEMGLKAIPPSYTAAGEQELPPGSGPYYLLDGSSLQIRGRANKPLKSATLIAGETKLPLEVRENMFGGEVFAGSVVAGTYWVEVEDFEELLLPGATELRGLGAREPARFKVRLKADKSPDVRATLQGVSGLVVRNARVPLSAVIDDDYAVNDIKIEYAWKEDRSEQDETTGAIDPADKPVQQEPNRATVDTALEVDSFGAPENSRLSLRVTAKDNDTINGPKVGESTRLLLRIVSEGELRADLLRREKEQRQLLGELVKTQDLVLTDTQAVQADLRGLAALEKKQRDAIVRMQKRQKLLGSNLEPMIERLVNMVAEVENNRLDDEQGALKIRIMENVVAPLRVAFENLSPLAVIALENARRSEDADARNALFTESIQRQQEVIVQMKAAMKNMVENEDFQLALNLLYEIQKTQQDLKVLTEKEKEARIKAILEKEAETDAETGDE
jgi:hypothetical protein